MEKVFICLMCGTDHPTKEEAIKCVLFHWFQDGLLEVDIYTIPKKSIDQLVNLDLEERDKK